MLPPSVKGGAVPWRLIGAAARLVIREEIRRRCEELEETEAGYVIRAAIARNRELKEQGRSWDDEEMDRFLKQQVPEAIAAARKEREQL